MFTNTDCCTVWERTVQNRAPAYIRHVTGRVYWEGTAAQQQAQKDSGTNRSSANHALVVIPAGNLGEYVPKPDDRIVRGLCSDNQPPPDAMTVMSVRDYRYGGPAVQHVEVTAE